MGFLGKNILNIGYILVILVNDRGGGQEDRGEIKEGDEREE